MGGLAQEIAALDFFPGIWIAPFLVHADSDFARDHPECLGQEYRWMRERFRFLVPSDTVREHFTAVFARIIGWGFRKLKIDISYGDKAQMGALLALFAASIRQLDPLVEIEAHMPDPFHADGLDIVRTNDVFLRGVNPAGSSFWHALLARFPTWVGRKAEGYFEARSRLFWQKARLCSPHKMHNLDYVGGNSPAARRREYFNHLGAYLGTLGVPAFSLLPDRFGPRASVAVREYLAFYSLYQELWDGAYIVESDGIPAEVMALRLDGATYVVASAGRSFSVGGLIIEPCGPTQVYFPDGIQHGDSGVREMVMIQANEGCPRFSQQVCSARLVSSGRIIKNRFPAFKRMRVLLTDFL
jgi:hypothetical protein